MYVHRDISERFGRIAESYGIVALVGARQAGKTTLLRELMKGRKSTYITFDDPDARSLFEEDIKKFELQYMEGVDLTVLDEAQYCADAGRKLKYLVDGGHRLWATSSSEILLGKEVLSHLVGRASIMRLYPFNLGEFLRARGVKAATPQMMERSAWEHMTYGGYPKVVTTEGLEMKATMLRDLYETMLLKDVARTFSISDIGALERCAKYLAACAGGIMRYSTVSNALDISFQTLKNYLDAMEKSYLTIPVRPFHTNKAKEIAKQPKIYFLDTGLRNAIAGRFDSVPDGRVFENYVLSEIVKAGFAPKYWRTKAGAEVDFVVETGEGVIPVEVKLSAEPGTVHRSMRAFIDEYEPKKALVVSYKGRKGTKRANGCMVTFTDVMGLASALAPGRGRR